MAQDTKYESDCPEEAKKFKASSLSLPLSSKPYARQPDLVNTVVFLEPLTWSQLHLVVLQETFVEKLLNDFVVQIFSNEHQLLASVSPFPFLRMKVDVYFTSMFLNRKHNCYKVPFRSPDLSMPPKTQTHLEILPRGV